MQYRNILLLPLALCVIALSGCAPKATSESLVGHWSLDAKTVETMLADSDADSQSAKMAKMFLKMASGGLVVEFTPAEMRTILGGKPASTVPYVIDALEENRVTISANGQSLTYTLTAADRMEFTQPGTDLPLRLNRMNASEVEALRQKMARAENGPDAGEPAASRFTWVINAPLEKAEAYLAKNPGILTETDDQGNTLLHFAARAKKRELAQKLVDAGASRSAVASNDETPFHTSLQFDFDPALSKLLHTDAIDLNAPTRNKRTLLENILQRSDLDPAKVAFLFELGADPDAGKAAGEKTPLLLAIEKSDLPAAKLLLKHGADINHRLFNNEQSALHVAARYGSPETIAFLLDQGMAADIPDKNKAAPITEIRFRNKDRIEAVELLVKAGADINAQSNHSTLLSDAIDRQKDDFAKQLIAAGADFDSKIGHRDSPYEMAKAAGRADLIAAMDAKRSQP